MFLGLLKKIVFIAIITVNIGVCADQTTIEADNINKINNNIEAKGNVVIQKDKYTLSTDKILYNRDERKFFLNRKAKMVSSDKQAIFAEKGIVDENIKNGEFRNAGLIFDKGISVFSKKMEKVDENNYIANDTDYYLCPNNNLKYDWNYDEIINELKAQRLDAFSIHSKTSEIKIDKKKIYLKHNVFRVFGVPVFYWPYISTSRPFVEMVSGWNLPYVEHLSNYGTGVYLPYTFFVSRNLKLKFEIGYYEKNAGVLKAKSSFGNETSQRIIDFVFIDDNNVSRDVKNTNGISEKNEGKYKKYRYLLDLNFKQQLSSRFFYDLDLHLFSDDYLNRDFLKDYDDYVKSDFNFSYINFDSFNYINFNAVSFDEINTNADIRSKTSPKFLPSINSLYTKSLSNNFVFNFKTNLVSTDVFNTNDIKYDKLSLFLNVDYNKYFEYFNLKTSFNLYNDNYYENTVITIPEHNKDVLSRIIPEVGIDLRTILVLNGNNNITFEPVLQYYTSPRNSKYDFNFLNEDSKRPEVNALNMFSGNRFGGTDRREYGNRINYGFINNYKIKDKKISLRIGQAFKDYFNKDIDIYGFYGEEFSDILGSFGYYDNYFDVNYLFNLDRKNYRFNSSEVVFNARFSRVSFYGNYVFFKKNVDTNRYEINELKVGTNYNFVSQFNLNYEFTRNLVYDRTVQNRIDLFYENNCAKSGISVRVDNYLNSKRDTSINFYFRIKNTMF